MDRSIKKMIEKIRGFQRDKNAPRGHFPPSSIDQTMGCPGSIRQCKDIPRIETSYSNEGRLAHEVCEAVYNHEYNGIPYSDNLNRALADQVDFGDEMESYAKKYLKVIEDVNAMVGKAHYNAIEQYVYIDDVRGPERIAGLIDYLVIGEKGAVVLDYKYGRNVLVGITHPQLLTYATALRDIVVPDYKFHVAVYQPRADCDDFKLHTYTHKELLAHYDKLEAMRDASKKKDAPLVLGKHCRWCPASRTKDVDHKCPAKDGQDVDRMVGAMNDVFTIAKQAELKIQPKDSQLKEFFEKLHVVKKYEKIFMEEIESRFERGEIVAGFKQIEKKGRRQWDGTPDELSMQLIDRFPKLRARGVTVEKMKGITEIEKVIGKNKLDDFTKVKNKQVIEFEDADIDDLLSRAELEVKYREED